MHNGGHILKLLYDLYKNIKFIITGSSSLEIAEKTAKYLVGRVFFFNLWQLSFAEYYKAFSQQLYTVYQERNNKIKDFLFKGKNFSFKNKDIFEKDFERELNTLSKWGSYPAVLKTDDRKTKREILKNIYNTYITKDIVELLKIADYSKFKMLISLLALQIGGLVNYNNLSSDIKIYFKELKKYISILEETYIIKMLKPFFRNKTTELKKNPKAYFIDTGIRNYCTDGFQDLFQRPDAGNLIENLVLSQFIYMQDDKYSIRYWRTMGGAEIDIILQVNKDIIPVEIKYSLSKQQKITRPMRSFINEYKPLRAVVLTKNYWAEEKYNSTIIKFIPVWYIG